MTALGLSCFAFVSTVLGGFFGLRAAGRMPELIAFSGGVMFGVVGFDILPELFEFSKQVDRSANIAMAGIVYGFIAFDLFKRLVGKYFHGKNVVDRGNAVVGATSATALIGHSVADGIGIGLGFQVSPTVGLAIAIAVIGHDFCDGLNTVGDARARCPRTDRGSSAHFADQGSAVLAVHLSRIVRWRHSSCCDKFVRTA
jgi:zinc transporter ZupT